jgi:ribosomal protein S18 acetylase RimI-like enzyme
MNNLVLKKSTPADSNFAYSVKKAAFKAYVDQSRGWDEEKQRQLHDQRFKTQDFRIISLDGNDVGIIALGVLPSCIKVYQLMLLPKYQGKHIGRKCILRVLNDAEQLDLPVRLSTLKVNPRAFAFYTKLGFVCTGETSTHSLLEWPCKVDMQSF